MFFMNALTPNRYLLVGLLAMGICAIGGENPIAAWTTEAEFISDPR